MRSVHRTLASVVLAFSFLTVLSSSVPIASAENPPTPVVASKKTMKYHLATCDWAKRIKPENLVKFETQNDAEVAGYIRCKICKP